MPTLVLRNVPEALHGKLKAAAAAHHRSMTQEAIMALRTLAYRRSLAPPD
jgi:plasmid stability protein